MGRIATCATLAAAAVLAAAGCGDTSTEAPPAKSATAPTAAPATSASTAAPWNPCTLPDDAIRATGLDPASRRDGLGGAGFSGWSACTWRASARWYSLSILAGAPTLDEIRARPDLTDLTPVTVGGRAGLQFGRASDPDHLGCTVALAIRGGTAAFDALTRYGEPQQEPPCTAAARHAGDLAPHLPS